MNNREFKILFKTEERYWWFIGQRYLLKRFLDKFYKKRNKEIKLLDVGCGAGINLKLLTNYGTAKGLDVSEQALEFCSKRGLSTFKSDIMKINSKKEEFDVITALGLFYHKDVTDDLTGFKKIYRILKPGGRFFMFDCAMKSLYGKHDLAFQGGRRYSRKELKSKLEKAGFTVERITYCNTLLFPVVYLKRKLEKLSSTLPKSEVKTDFNPFFNLILKKMYLFELYWLKYFSYPFGINIMVVARK